MNKKGIRTIQFGKINRKGKRTRRIHGRKGKGIRIVRRIIRGTKINKRGRTRDDTEEI
jgi:hypothetical protein